MGRTEGHGEEDRERERKERQRENVDVGATLTPNMPVNGGGLVCTRGEGKKPTHHIHKTSDNGKAPLGKWCWVPQRVRFAISSARIMKHSAS